MKTITDDIIIKYQANRGLSARPSLTGESHRMVLVGYTQGNTRGYAYPRGITASEKIKIPVTTNMVIRVKGVVTVIGGTSAIYKSGVTEAFAYYTAFKRDTTTISQLGTAGGTVEFGLKEGGLPATCELYIDANSDTGELRFGLDDSRTDTERIWQLSVDLDVNTIDDMLVGYNPPYALWQSLSRIELENSQPLLWN